MSDECTCPSCRDEDKTMADQTVPELWDVIHPGELRALRADKAKLEADVSALEAKREEFREAWEAAAENVFTLSRENERLKVKLHAYRAARAALKETGRD